MLQRRLVYTVFDYEERNSSKNKCVCLILSDLSSSVKGTMYFSVLCRTEKILSFVTEAVRESTVLCILAGHFFTLLTQVVFLIEKQESRKFLLFFFEYLEPFDSLDISYCL